METNELPNTEQNYEMPIVKEPKVTQKYVFETIDDVERKQHIKVSDDFKTGFEVARLIITQEEMKSII